MMMFLLIAAGVLPWVLIADAVVGDDEDQADLPTDVTGPTEPIYPTDVTDATDVTPPINGTNDENRLIGTQDDDRLNGRGGDDVLNGGTGNDTLDGGTENDTLYGGDGDDTLFGGAGSDYLSGGDGANVLFGGLGDDSLRSQGADTLFGGEGRDSFIISVARASQTVDPDTGDVIWDLSDLQRADLPVIGDLSLEDSVRLFSWSELPIATIRFEEADGGGDQVNVIADFQTGADEITSITLARLDSPEDGYEAMFDDLLTGQNLTMDDAISTGTGTASLTGGNGHDAISAYDFPEDYFFGDDLPDILDVVVDGGGGDDWINLGLGTDTAMGGDGNDTIIGFDNAWALNSGTGYPQDGYGADLIDGGAGDDYLTGGDLSTVGLAGDTLLGATGDDTLVGNGFGMPVAMTGGEGADLFVARGAHTEVVGFGSEIFLPNDDPIEVTDFTIGEDLLEVTGVDRIRTITLTETSAGDTEVSINYVYDTTRWSEEDATVTLFVLRGVTGASVEDLFGADPQTGFSRP